MLSGDLAGRQRLDSRAAIRSAFDTLLEETRRSLKLFDVDGELYGLERSSVAIELRRLLRGQPDSEITIVVHEVAFLERQAPHLVGLLTAFAPRLRVLQADDSLRRVDKGFVIADKVATLRRPSFQQSLAFLDYDEADVASADALFEQLLALCGPGLNGRPSGL